MRIKTNNNQTQRRIYGEFESVAHVRQFAIDTGMGAPTTIRKLGKYVWACFYGRKQYCDFCGASDCKLFVVSGRLACPECRDNYRNWRKVTNK